MLVPSALSAYVAIDGQDQIRVDKNIEDNAYVTAGKLDINANTSGDLYAAGGEINITGNV